MGRYSVGELNLHLLPDDESTLPIALRFTRTGSTPAAIVAGALVRPSTDNTLDLGSGSNRWNDIFLGTAPTVTSDAREKTTPRALAEVELRAVRRVLSGIGVFQWLDAIARKGEGGARLHVGVTAQAVAAAFIAEGLDPARYALWCEDPVFEDVEIEPARFEDVTEPDPDTGAPRTVQQLRPAVLEQRPAIDPATGQQRTRLGIRPDQLMWLALKALAAV